MVGHLGSTEIVQKASVEFTSQEITLFKSLGVAVEDVRAADLVYRKALGTPPS